MIDPAAGYILILGLTVLLGSAGLHKLRRIREFLGVIVAYRLIPVGAAPAALYLLPGLELLTALGLIVPASRQAACMAAAGLLLVYGCAIGINLARGRRDVDCGCSVASGRRPIAAWMLVRNGAVACAALGAALPWSPRPLTWVDLVTVIAGTSAAALLYASVDSLLGTVAPAAATARAR